LPRATASLPRHFGSHTASAGRALWPAWAGKVETDMKRIAWIAVGLAFGFVFGGVASGRAVPSMAYGDADAYRELQILGRAVAVVRAYYVRPVADSALIDAAIQGMVSSLDPHSRYIDAKSFAGLPHETPVETEGDFANAGLEVEPENGDLRVVSLIHGTEAAQSAIRVGDKIEAIDGQSIADLSEDDAIGRMRGPAANSAGSPVGSKVTLTLVPKDGRHPFDVTVTRAAAEGEAVRDRREGDVGYIHLPRFGEHDAEGVEQAVRDLKRHIGPGIKGYVLDLRDNPGGSLDQAIRICGDFLGTGEIVSAHGRNPGDTKRFDAVPLDTRPMDGGPGDIAGGKPLVLLIDSGTASVSEIVAGALQDHKRATVIGMTSFGKGSAQTVIPLAEGALSLTSAFYFTPSGHPIQARGITPDIAVAEGDEEDAPAFEPVAGAVPADQQSGDQVDVTPRPPVIRAAPGAKYDDFQLAYALDLLRGQKTVAASVSEPIQQITLYFDVRIF
jgi:carboxyl-terminal processing protease